MTEHPPTPMLDKIVENSEESNAIGRFLEWMAEQGIRRMRYVPDAEQETCIRVNRATRQYCTAGRITVATLVSPYEQGVHQAYYVHSSYPCAHCHGTGHIDIPGWVQDRRTIIKLLAEYYDVDEAQAEDERRAVLDWVREQHGEFEFLGPKQ